MYFFSVIQLWLFFASLGLDLYMCLGSCRIHEIMLFCCLKGRILGFFMCRETNCYANELTNLSVINRNKNW